MNRIEAIIESLGIKVASKRGNRAWSHCPFHSSEQPTTFFIRLSGPRAGQNFCFSCKHGGALPELVMHVRGCDYSTAKAFISSIGHGFQPPRAKVAVVARPPKIGRSRFKLPNEVIFDKLEYWVTQAREYTKSRGITQKDVFDFRIGYAIDGPLSCRIVLPWISTTQQIVGYSARTFVDDEPRYKTPKESDNADFGTMVGEHLWPESKQRGILIVTEGGFNALAVKRVLPEDANIAIGAMGGSEINPTHIIKMATFGLVIVMTDADDAGDKSASVIQSSLARHTPTRRARLPDKQDHCDVTPEFLRRFVQNVLKGST